IGKVRSAMMYPLVVIVLAAGIVAFILVFIVPEFKNIYDQLGAELPGPTQILVDAGYILANQTIWVVIGLILLFIIYKKINGTKEGKYRIDQVKLKIPVFGQLFRKTAIVRF